MIKERPRNIKLDRRWGYTLREGMLRPLTAFEHDCLARQRDEDRARLTAQIEHDLETVDRYQADDPDVAGTELVQVIIPRKSFRILGVLVDTNLLKGKLEYGSEIEDGWLIKVSDAEELMDKFPEHVVRYPTEQDLEEELLRRVSPYEWDVALLRELLDR